jgi:cytochrome c oxidase subunit 2
MRPGWVVVLTGSSLALGFVLGRLATSTRPFDAPAALSLTPAPAGAAPSAERVVRVEAKRFAFSPARIELKKGEPVVLELVSLDRTHGFNVPELGLRYDIKPGSPTRIPFKPMQAGTFAFHCDVFCGSGHEGMEGEIVVLE